MVPGIAGRLPFSLGSTQDWDSEKPRTTTTSSSSRVLVVPTAVVMFAEVGFVVVVVIIVLVVVMIIALLLLSAERSQSALHLFGCLVLGESIRWTGKKCCQRSGVAGSYLVQ